MNLSFENKVALITGAGSGMGLATARAFAEAGAAVVLADVREEAVRAAAEELVAAGRKVIAVRCDVADEAPTLSHQGRGSWLPPGKCPPGPGWDFPEASRNLSSSFAGADIQLY